MEKKYDCFWEQELFDDLICVNIKSKYCGKQCKIKEFECKYYEDKIIKNRKIKNEKSNPNK